jgi:hypothetical protein
MVSVRVPRSERCLTGHRTWDVVELDVAAADGPLADVFAAASACPHTDLEPYLHPFNVQATCDCGQVVASVGTDWADPPLCPSCASRMRWLNELQIDRVNGPQAESLEILGTPLATLGVPDGGMLVARGPGRPVRRLLLR